MSWCFSVFWCLNFISWQSCCVWFDRSSRSTNSDNFVSLIMLYKEDTSMKRINLIWLHQHLMDKDKLVLSIKYLKKQLQNSVMIRSIAQMDLLSLLLQWRKCQTLIFLYLGSFCFIKNVQRKVIPIPHKSRLWSTVQCVCLLGCAQQSVFFVFWRHLKIFGLSSITIIPPFAWLSVRFQLVFVSKLCALEMPV